MIENIDRDEIELTFELHPAISFLYKLSKKNNWNL